MPHFPEPFISTVSHWQATNRSTSSLYSHTHPRHFPDHADIVIIGGGTMGASLAYFMTREGGGGEGKKIVLLEAKDVGSGASGRNGGHIGPATHKAFMKATAPIPHGSGLSDEDGLKVVQQERDNLDLIANIIDKEGWTQEVDFWKGELCEVHMGDETSSQQKSVHEKWLALRKEFGYTSDTSTRWYDESEAIELSRMKTATSCLTRPAGSVHSHRLCTTLMKAALASSHFDFQLFTWMPVDSISPDKAFTPTEAAKTRWNVKTSQGTIRATRVVLCTNAHTRELFPEGGDLYDQIFPVYGQCALITPPPSYSGNKALERTYNMSAGGYYMVQKGDGGIVLGGGESEMIKLGILKPNERVGLTDDSTTIPAWTKVLANYMPQNFVDWGEEAEGEGLTKVWSGILGYSKDMLPLVGEIPEEDGLFIAAGFSGHGQSRIFSCAKSLAHTLKTGEWDERILPRCFAITTPRLERCRGHPQITSRLVETDVPVEKLVKAQQKGAVDEKILEEKVEMGGKEATEAVNSMKDGAVKKSGSCLIL